MTGTSLVSGQWQKKENERGSDEMSGTEKLEEAIWNAVVAAETMTGRDGNTLTALPHDDLARWFNQYHGRTS